MEFKTCLPSPLGNLLLTSDGRSLTGLSLGWEGPEFSHALPLFDSVSTWLTVYFEGRDPGPLPCPLAPAGTPFQQEIWALVRQIPYGETITYGELARRSGRSSKSARAIGQAVGRNPIAILIPCHRVLGQGGSLTGYAWGTQLKSRLLTLENP